MMLRGSIFKGSSLFISDRSARPVSVTVLAMTLMTLTVAHFNGRKRFFQFQIINNATILTENDSYINTRILKKLWLLQVTLLKRLRFIAQTDRGQSSLLTFPSQPHIFPRSTLEDFFSHIILIKLNIKMSK